ncbi:MAG: hypothetical protein M3Q07_24535 [Pseudobdellovibrionaceae bacterium]|nr:hypothetical protein [Pseudobdellovibrionaceae bacterium]
MKSFPGFLFPVLLGLQTAHAADAPPLAYYKDVKPIVDAYCASCHSPGQIAPFSLTNYTEVFRFRKAIVTATQSKSMPPWKVDPLHDYIYDISLPAPHIQRLKDWVDQGAAAGDPMDVGPSLSVDKGQIESIDAVARMNAPYHPNTENDDDYRCFLLDWEPDQDTFIKGYKVVPGNPKLVHHVALYLVDPKNLDKVTALVDEDEQDGYQCFGGPYTKGKFAPMPFVGIGGPGNGGFIFPEDTGIAVARGSRFVMQVHYSSAKAEDLDQTEVQFQLSQEKLKAGVYLPVMNVMWPFLKDTMKIPAGQDNVSHSWQGNPLFSLVGLFFPSKLNYFKGVKVYGVAPHMHRLGKSITLDIVRRDKSVEPLISVSNWNFHWQNTFFYKQPIYLGPLDQVKLTCTWDNSKPRHEGESTAGLKDVYWGESTEDEMCTSAMFIAEP